jgi:predicted dehydrogenase
MRKYRVGVLGCGFFAQLHLHAWRELANVEIAAVCDRDPAKAQRAAESFGAKYYLDAEEMFKEGGLDFVDVATTMDSHVELVHAALQAGLGVIVQKPLAPTWEACLAIAEAARATGLPVMVHENFRFQRPMLRAREIIRAGEIGTPTWGRISFRTAFNFYANQPYLRRQEQLILLEVGVHLTDLARVFFGEVREVSSMTQQLGEDVRGEDQATVLCRHANHAVSILDVSFQSRPETEPMGQTLVYVEGERGSVSVGMDFKLAIRAGDQVCHEETTPRPLSWAGPWAVASESIVNIFEHWVEAFSRGSEPETSVFDNLKSYAIVMAAYDAQRLGRNISLKNYEIS